jgi:hypothetical protein
VYRHDGRLDHEAVEDRTWTYPGTLVASEEGVGVFMGNWLGGNRAYGVKRGDRVFLEMYLTGE